ncbi:hypothetical protein PPYR_06486 [Photinus pyralis]|uniref:Mos1 transposase HTH domain-containing protein n=1 Tax=Photinus pyralis TaxID=7054 RepID=A0A5N4ATU0_PHOPY|nr:hypothetical protein PPYR_06486 [Photinus pyralis]
MEKTLEKTEYRAVIKFFILEGLSATEIHTKMVNVLKESAPSFPTVHRWVLEVKRGRTCVQDESKTATTPEVIQQIHNVTKEYSLHEELHMKILFGKLAPHSLTIQQKLDRKQISLRHLERFKQNKTDFLRRFITMDGTWIYHHDSKLRQERLQWTEAGCSAPKQVKSERSPKKVMASGF